MGARRQPASGFTLVEIMVSLGLLVIGLAGVLALHLATVRGNRVSRQLERARVLSAQAMEDLRGQPMSTLILYGMGEQPYGDVVTPVEGTTYTRSYTLSPVSGSLDLVLLTTTTKFPDDQDESVLHSASLQMLRTKQENL